MNRRLSVRTESVMSNDRAQYGRTACSQDPKGLRGTRARRLHSEGLVRGVMRFVRLVGAGSRRQAVSRQGMPRAAGRRAAAWMAFRHPASQAGARQEGARAVVALSAATRKRAA